MEDRFVVRRREMMAEAELDSGLLIGVLDRLGEFVRPFAVSLTEPEQRKHTAEYVSGLLSGLEHKTGEAIAYLHDQERQGIQKFIGHVPWDHRPLVSVLAAQVGSSLGEADGVIVFDPSGFGKKGPQSVGVARQWCGRLGKVENCQVGIYLGYVSRRDHALVDFRLYLPKEWTNNRKRCTKAGVPAKIRFQTRHEQALEMLKERGPQLPHAWVTGDDEMGRSSDFRQKLRGRDEHYLLAVPSNTLIRDREAEAPPYSGRGRRPEVPFGRVDRWIAALPETAWTTITVRDGEKGPLVTEAVCRRVQARAGRKVGPEEILFVTRERLADQSFKHDYYLSFAPEGTSLAEFARVAKAEHEIEDCFKRGKSHAGLGDYQVRNWMGWHHHQTLSLIAAWFLSAETRQGGKRDTGPDGATRARHSGVPVGGAVAVQQPAHDPKSEHPLDAAKRTGEVLLASRA
jgi:SRSO17 transposase